MNDIGFSKVTVDEKAALINQVTFTNPRADSLRSAFDKNTSTSFLLDFTTLQKDSFFYNEYKNVSLAEHPLHF